MRLVHTALLISVITLSACSEQQQTQPQMQAPQVDVSTPITSVITQWDEYTGRFGAVEEVEIRARVSGYLDKVNFKDGQTVAKGDVLFVIDQRPFEIALRSAKSRFDLAKKELDRGNDLRRKNSISQEEVDRRLNEFENARASYENAKLEMEFTEVKSPIDGLVSRDLVNIGNLVNGSANNATLLTTVVSIDPIHFYFDAGEGALLKYMRLSQSAQRESSRTAPNPVKIKLQDETEYAHEGVMDFVDNRVERSTGTILARAILENDDGFLLPGIFGRVRLLARENVEALLIPDAVIGTDQSRKFVYTLNEENQVGRKFITLGELYTPELRVIEAGLVPNDRIIVNGLMRIRPGMPAEPVEVDIREQFSL
ncbi:MAG: efflux RND transporter periplasmic adaptor subunit [Aliiglaciecola sp.]